MFLLRQASRVALCSQKQAARVLCPVFGSISSVFNQAKQYRSFSSSSANTKCLEFVIDEERAQESLAYWLNKSTNLKSVNAEIRKAYLPFYCFNFTIYTTMNGSTVATEYNDSNQNQRQLCQIYAGADYNYNMLEKVKSKLIEIQPFTSEMMEDIDEVDPWNMYKSTAWNIVQTAVEEEEKTKLNVRLKANNKKNVEAPVFRYTNIVTQKVYLPVYIAESKEMRRIPYGKAYHIFNYQKNVPFIHITKTILPAILSALHILYDSLSYIYVNHYYNSIKKKEKEFEQKGQYYKVKEVHRKEFAYQAKMRRRREKYPRLFQTVEKLFNIDDDSYVVAIHHDESKQYKKAKKHAPKEFVGNSYYDRLHVAPSATTEEIRKAFQREIKKYHPDYYKGPDAETKSREIIEAYFTLRDPTRRKEYDQNHSF